MPEVVKEASFKCWQCWEFVRAFLEKDETEPGLWWGQCPKCAARNKLFNPSWGPQGLNEGRGEPAPDPEAPYDGRASLVEHLVNILAPAKNDVRAFMSDQALPEDMFVISQNIWNYLDRALKKARELA